MPEVMTRPRRVARRAIAAVAFLAFVACGDDSATEPTNQSVAGTWTLRTVNGSNLPYTLQQFGNDRVELLNETINVAASGTFTQQGTLRFTAGGIVTTEPYTDAGTYTLNGSTATFSFNSDGSTGVAAIGDDVLSVAYSGQTFVYRR